MYTVSHAITLVDVNEVQITYRINQMEIALGVKMLHK